MLFKIKLGDGFCVFYGVTVTVFDVVASLYWDVIMYCPGCRFMFSFAIPSVFVVLV